MTVTAMSNVEITRLDTLMRMQRVLRPQSRVLKASMIFFRAPAFSLGATASSRSRMTRSASDSRARAIALGREAGEPPQRGGAT